MGEVKEGDSVVENIYQSIKQEQIQLQDCDILVVTQKIVSKVEGRIVNITTVIPSAFAQSVATQINKDPRHCEVILRETKRIVRMDKGVLICETHQGFICANAGVDASNVENTNTVSLLPEHPDISARTYKDQMKELSGKDVAVIISDTWGRPWREGQVNMAIGIAGINPLIDYRGQKDTYGYEMQASVIATADELASAAELVMGKADGVPVAIIRGYKYSDSDKNAQALLRKPENDLFR